MCVLSVSVHLLRRDDCAEETNFKMQLVFLMGELVIGRGWLFASDGSEKRLRNLYLVFFFFLPMAFPEKYLFIWLVPFRNDYVHCERMHDFELQHIYFCVAQF